MISIIRRSVCLGSELGEKCARRLVLSRRQFSLFGSDEKEAKVTGGTAADPKPAVDEKSAEEIAADFQRHAFKNEQCFLVNEEDRVVGQASKADCHKVRPGGSILLHRAFSVFMFNSKGLLLLQKRSPFKITYPEHYTNTCCSHPIVNMAGEDEEAEALGVRRAAQRRLSYEMGIPIENIPLEELKYITRVRYMDTSAGKWGENEIDYILFFKSDFDVKPNPDEICEIAYVPRADIDHHLSQLEAPITPWFRLILKYKLKLWWDNLDSIEDYVEHVKIKNLTPNSDL